MSNHAFTEQIIVILKTHFTDNAKTIFENSPLLGYLNIKTKSANSGSKARGAFANHYALYVLIEDYINKGFFDNSATIPYTQYEGAMFSELLKRQRELPFGDKLQNHALNSRLNDEFEKYYPLLNKKPIVRNKDTQRYWIQEDLLYVTINQTVYNIAQAIIDIINCYVETKKTAFENFISICQELIELENYDFNKVIQFVNSQLKPNVDARIFEIVSYAILKVKYGQETIWIGKEKESVLEETLILYKTGRTNANDGGIDFVMKPLGRFFQVTETIEVTKYFLDIDKVQRFPITFVIKSDKSVDTILKIIKFQAKEKYKIDSVVDSYMNAIEEIINTEQLLSIFYEIIKVHKTDEVMNEIITQSKLEFNYISH